MQKKVKKNEEKYENIIDSEPIDIHDYKIQPGQPYAMRRRYDEAINKELNRIVEKK